MKQSIDQILNYFDLSKYENLEQFSASDWSKALSYRASLFNHDTDEMVDILNEVVDDFDIEKNTREISARHKEDTVKLVSNPTAELRKDSYGLVKLKSPIRDLSIFDAWEYKFYIEGNLINHTQAFLDYEKNYKEWYCQSSDIYPEESDYLKCPDRPVKTSRSLHSTILQDLPYSREEIFLSKIPAALRVDLSYDDKDLKNSFNEWLQSKRKEMDTFSMERPKYKPPTEVDFRKWRQHKVIECIDILILSKAFHIDIPNFKIGQALYPELDIDVSEKIRKVTKPLARLLMGADTINSLMLIADKK